MQSGTRAFSVVQNILDVEVSYKPKASTSTTISSLTKERRSASLSEAPFNTTQLLEDVRSEDNESDKSRVLYLAYGSNLAAEKFKGARGMKPLSQINVHVPELELTFDLPGIPYSEPCFANTRYRSKSTTNDYHKDRWHKGLVGVVYEVTKSDYATIIATEGGGSGYQDIIVDCYEIPEGKKELDEQPTSEPFKAHTLYAPALPLSPPCTPPKSGGRISRPDPSYAQPSARYLKLITDGAEEHNLPQDYKNFLYELRSYRITSTRQRLGQFIFLSIWSPIVLSIFALGNILANSKGRIPKWLAVVMSIVFQGIWISYDAFFKKVFGDGERTEEDSDNQEAMIWGFDEKRPLIK